ncbi:MAG TPA: peptidoglycan bridge formation glycyltransferase FemA/FemB family protein, partial [Caldilineaceae bacterium]|nr:peptidoglycan bridge formation glycyltransferase FemA/FemB family protein [Caldilineaceae bacterium]
MNPWNDFVEHHPAAHPLQTCGWAELKGRFGWQFETVTHEDGQGAPQAGALVLFRRMAGLTLAYTPRGPLTDWRNRTQTASLL